MPKKYVKPDKRTEADWSAIWDAQSLSNAEIIKNDAVRFKSAKEWAALLVKEEKEEAKAMQTVADMN